MLATQEFLYPGIPIFATAMPAQYLGFFFLIFLVALSALVDVLMEALMARIAPGIYKKLNSGLSLWVALTIKKKENLKYSRYFRWFTLCVFFISITVN
jgi:hypothetical protein